MKPTFKKIDNFLDKVSNSIIQWILFLAMLFVLYKFCWPYIAGDYKMKTDYYYKNK